MHVIHNEYYIYIYIYIYHLKIIGHCKWRALVVDVCAVLKEWPKIPVSSIILRMSILVIRSSEYNPHCSVCLIKLSYENFFMNEMYQI